MAYSAAGISSEEAINRVMEANGKHRKPSKQNELEFLRTDSAWRFANLTAGETDAFGIDS